MPTNTDNYNTEIRHDGGYGYNYTVSDGGVLILKGWIRCNRHVDAIQLVRALTLGQVKCRDY